MPPRVSFTRERILQQAFEIVRSDGLDVLSAREIGQRLTAPPGLSIPPFNR